ncbi:MAG TPA: cupin domain-containing protein [Pyrinomonadaceae bacterium]|jgi:anti-sigma factor ChrR (cupin superfamily)
MKHSGTEDEFQERASSYALGALERGEAVFFEQHLAEGCEVCASELRDFEEVAAALALCTAQAPRPQLRGELLARLGAEPGPGVAAAASGQSYSQAMLALRTNEGEWQETSSGVFVKELFRDQAKGITTSLVKLTPGTVMPAHRHVGFEQCYVLEGDFHVAELAFGSGDFTYAPADSVHGPLYTNAGTVLLIVAAGGYVELEQHA